MSAEREKTKDQEVAADPAATPAGEVQMPPAPGSDAPAPVAEEEPSAVATDEPVPVTGEPEPEPAGEGEASFADAEAPLESSDAAADAESPVASSDTVAAPDDELATAQQEAARYLALAQRTQADFDNFRRRAAREAAAAADRGTSRLAKEILPALDHLELALQASEQDPAAAELTKGVRLVQGEVVKALSRVGIQAYSPQGEAFDPEQHEAMAQLPKEGAESGTVVEVYQQGYRLNGSVLRPARVVVAA